MKNHDGMILLKKPEGVTSFQALGILKRKLETKKVGHTGTLDKFATGLLVILTGKMTKFAPFITGMDKRYQATFKFGQTTSTLDPEGEIIDRGEIPTLETIKKTIGENFIGKISQIPPDFSAVHIGGKRAYQLKLSGQEVNIPPRNIEIKTFEILDWDGESLKVDIGCSKGTYIRSIARDLGKLCNSCAYVTQLHRSEVGPFSDLESVTGDDFTENNLIDPYTLISDLDRKISFVSETGKNDILNGKRVKKEYYLKDSPVYNDGEVALFDADKNFVAMISLIRGKSSFLFVSSR